MGWAKGLATPSQLIHVDMCTAERAGWFGKKGWATHLFRELQVALPGLRAVRLIPAGSTVDSLLGIMATHTVGKPKPGFCAIYSTTGLSQRRSRLDIDAVLGGEGHGGAGWSAITEGLAVAYEGGSCRGALRNGGSGIMQGGGPRFPDTN